MSGLYVSESQSLSNSCNGNLTVNMYSTAYLPNSQYCVNGTHVFADNSLPPSSACLTTQANSSKVIHTTFEQLQSDDLPIDVNPNTGGGLRIFPDKKIPTEMTDRRKILVRAKIGSNAAGIKVYFRNFDFDDPSANAAPIDANGSAGNDNKGNVDGTTNTRAGQFSASLSQYDCQISAAGAECFTDSNGETIVYFSLTMQPGDNFSVVAGTDSAYLNSLTLAADGVNLKDTSNVQTPVSRTSDITECYRSAVNVCRTDMLTVWRRLHIEVDSMGIVQNNFFEGIMPRTIILSANNQLGGSEDIELNLPANSNFGGGRLASDNGVSLYVDGSSCNAQNICTVSLTNKGFRKVQIPQGTAFKLYDDDDFNVDDQGSLNGDFQEDVGYPNNAFENSDNFKHIQNADGLYSDGTPKNVYAPSYIRPEYDWSKNNYNQDNIPFLLNINENENDLLPVIDQHRGSRNSESDNFWVAYILIAYQGNKAEDGDGDIHTPGIARNGFTSDVVNDSQSVPAGCDGAIFFIEVASDRERQGNPSDRPVLTTIAHEIGHQFGILGDQANSQKIMGYYPNGPVQFEFIPDHLNLMRWRIPSPGKPEYNPFQ